MASTSSQSSYLPDPDVLEALLSKLQVPDGFRLEDMVTFQENEKTNHHPNYISKTTRFSTIFKIVEAEEIYDTMLRAHYDGRREPYFVLKELRQFRRSGFLNVTIRDLSPQLQDYFGFLPWTIKNDKDAQNSGKQKESPKGATNFSGTIHWEVETIIKCFDVLPHDVMDLIVANLPTEDVFRYRSVCKGWYSMLTSCPSFQALFRESSKRRPWFLLLKTLTSPKRQKPSSSTILPEAVYNMEVAAALGDWCQINIEIPTPRAGYTARMQKVDFVSSGGLICSMSGSNSFIVSNPCTGSSHQLPSLPDSEGGDNVKGMALHVSPCSKLRGRLRYRVYVVIVQKDRTLRIKIYSSSLNSQERGTWTEKMQLNLAVPFLYNVWNPKRITGVATIGGEGQLLLHFVTRDGSKSVCCDTQSGTIFMNPGFPSTLECCKVTELVVCNGTLYAVLILSGDVRRPIASRHLQVFKLSRDDNDNNAMNKWMHVTTLPQELSTRCCINKRDHDRMISCAGYGNYIMVYVTCASSNFTIQSNYALMFNINEKAWVLLPPQPSGDTRTAHKIEICSLMPDIDY